MQLLCNGFFYLIATGFLIIDVCLFSFFEQQLFYPLLCLYIICILQHPTSYIRTAFLMLLIMLDTFIYYGHVMPLLWYIIPITILSFIIKQFLYSTTWPRYVLLAICLIAKNLIIEPYFFASQPAVGYTLLALFVNIVVMMLFSLKYPGKLGNRS